MKHALKFLFLVLLVACGKPGDHTGHNGNDEGEDEGPNKALYNQVMDIHDEVMPKMSEIERLKRELSEEISNSPEMVVEKKQQLTQIISNLDSAGASMMNWMHEFNPPPDSVSEEEQREYLESEMERIKKVRALMNESIEKAKDVKKN